MRPLLASHYCATLSAVLHPSTRHRKILLANLSGFPLFNGYSGLELRRVTAESTHHFEFRVCCILHRGLPAGPHYKLPDF